MAEPLPSIDDFFSEPPSAPADLGKVLRFSPMPASATPGPAMPLAPEPVAPEQTALPSVDDFFSGHDPQDWAAKGVPFQSLVPPGDVQSGAIVDDYYSKSTAGKLLDWFAQGARDGWGSEPFGLAPETEDALKKYGLIADYKKERFNLVKGYSEALIRGVAGSAEALTRGLSAAYRGAQTTITEAGKEAQQSPIGAAIDIEHLTRDIAGFPEAFMGSPQGLMLGHVDLPQARSLRVIGEGEAGWKGNVEPQALPDAPQTVKEAIATQADESPPTGAAEPGEAAATGAPQPAPDIHAVAREIAPATFQKYDALQARQDTFRRWLQELGDQRAERPRVKEANDEIATILGKVKGVEDRLTNKASERLSALRAEVEDLTTSDSPDMAQVRAALLKNDFEMRDLGPEVAAAYRQAGERLPAQVPEAEAPQAAPETPSPAEAVAAPAPSEPAPAAPAPPPGPANENAVTDIQADVSRRLVGAGRPQEEADAAAALVKAHYDARAARFGGAKGTAEEMYNREAPVIESAEKGGRKGEAAGKTVLRDGQRVITLFGKADASTFIHETGHAWLEELDKDAADPAATPQTKADAAAVRKWSGAPETGEIPTRAHEKFARGFERYLMEGRAPTQALARVFRQFKDWLTTIYQTVAKLRAPITDDIRAVMDRLVSSGSERPVIAEDRPAGPSIHDIHEADAEHTPPQFASAQADRIRQETDEIAAKTAPREVHDELTQRGPGGSATPDAGAPGGGAEAEPVATGNGNAAESGAVNAGRDKAAPKGAGGEQPTSPHGQYGEPETAFLDKAGNIRLENINTPSDVDELIREIADENEGFIGARRGVVSDQQVLDLADAMGVRPEDLDIQKLRRDYSPEKVMAVRKLFVQTANDTHALAEKAAGGSLADLETYITARSRMKMVQGYMSALTAESGRILRAYRKIEGSDAAKSVADMVADVDEPRTLFQMRKEAQKVAALDSPAKVAGFLKDADKPSYGDMLVELYKNWLISGPLTHMGYSVGNTVLALWKAVPETAAQAAIGAAREVLTGTKGERVRFGEVGAQLYAILRGQRNGFRAAWESFRSGQTMPLPGEMAASAKTLFTQKQAIPDIKVAGATIPLGSIVRIPGERMVAPIHSYFRSIGYEQGIARLAYRQASEEGLTGSAFNARIADLTVHPSEDMMAAAREESTQQTLMGKGGEFTQRVSGLVNWAANLPFIGKTKILAFVDPFVHISANVMEQSVLERSPLGLLSKQIREEVSGAHGKVRQDTAIAKMAVGSSLSVVAGGLAMEGVLTPSAPSDPNARSTWQRVNGMPHSLRIGEMSYDLSRMGVLGFQMSIAADMYHAAHVMETDEKANVASLLVHSVAQNLLDEGFMRGISDAIKALDEPDRYGAGYVRNLVSALAVPYSVGSAQIAGQIDPYAREARTLMDAIKRKIPGESETLFPMIDIWGQPIPNRDWMVTYQAHVTNDPVDKTLVSLGYYPARPERKIRGIELTDQQYYDYQTLAGQMAHQRVSAIVGMAGFDSLPNEVRHDMIQKAITESRETARAMVMLSNPTIVQRAVNDKTQRLAGSR